ncbi:hypothetical protein GPB2148_518 [marine gamma proteobacterium HTCC2148]|nr:hypothetical protein GPB2148_518 [marine gamma proteobacterium HTCC2148]
MLARQNPVLKCFISWIAVRVLGKWVGDPNNEVNKKPATAEIGSVNSVRNWRTQG